MRVFVEYGPERIAWRCRREGEIAFALSSVRATWRSRGCSTSRCSWTAPWWWPASATRWRARRTLGAGDLALYPWVLARRWELERKALDELFAEAGLAPIEPEIETTSATLMKTLVAQSDFLTFVPREMIYWEERTKLLRPLRAIRCSWARHVGADDAARHRADRGGARLIGCLRDAVPRIAPG